MDDCLFCKIASGEMDADVVHTGDKVVAFRDINPGAPTHVLLIPKEHLADGSDLTPQHADLLAEIFTTAQQLASADGVDESGYRIVVNRGPNAGQSVMHLHFHLLGGRRLGWPPG
jgi:histidine triad (HIT) family protein